MLAGHSVTSWLHCYMWYRLAGEGLASPKQLLTIDRPDCTIVAVTDVNGELVFQNMFYEGAA